MRGRKPKPTALKLIDGNPGKRPINANEPKTTGGKPTCPSHLSPTAKSEWKRISGTLHEMGILTAVDRAALAAYCQAYARWVDAEKKLAATPALIKTPSGYVQQSPWLSVANKQMELMGRFMAELGITPASRSRIAVPDDSELQPRITQVTRIILPAPGTADQGAPGSRHLPQSALGQLRDGKVIDV